MWPKTHLRSSTLNETGKKSQSAGDFLSARDLASRSCVRSVSINFAFDASTEIFGFRASNCFPEERGERQGVEERGRGSE